MDEPDKPAVDQLAEAGVALIEWAFIFAIVATIVIFIAALGAGAFFVLTQLGALT